MRREDSSTSTEDDSEEQSLLSLAEQPFSAKIRDARYLTFLFIGIGLLWPWNCILGASQYFKHDVFLDGTIWSKIFASSMMTVSTVSSTMFNIWLARRQHSYSERVVKGLMWEVVVFVVLGVLTLMKSWISLSILFLSIMALVAISSLATAMTQNGVMAVANVYGAEFSQAVMVGQAVAGVLPSIVLFVISFLGDPSKQSTSGILMYFLTTAAVSIISIVLYRVNQIGTKVIATVPGMSAKSSVPFKVLYGKLKYLVLSIFTSFVVTLIFPVFASSVLVKGLPLANSEYIPFVFTMWNLGDLYGRVIADWPKFRSPKFTPHKTFVYSVMRVLFVPLFFYFSRDTPSSFPILQDLLYILLQFLFGLTNGHVISISFMKVPEVLSGDIEREAAGGFTNIFVSAGLTLGSVFSYGWVFLMDAFSRAQA
ncbi:related to Nucleoside transporter FUN26 [Zygosaccharomyces bailii]|uniref:ZYBA0S07-04324g1_1 n=1 Tax=Zygosaccharomyces bailii (strain CLIB 213 / ATCC 58445 / CBS 680 / BCRC 21525 / NBRC 1098 / NCYC 1416 / NRRL Y-2227) TaxID=1333698 RepID=A0A8J2T8X6_ZYGB2|nr:ZYBA0S07-04324g1_1 [Zygosaccharomyces bailii CLIB 213]CDH15052.1 related to Nucleoside transporter FUN26 [Zygosaccharomyces bailii ISA1307]SJM84203.1 related to Nucleoside transporter FUN26 [Zygosaccharomyces bailii]